MEIYAGVDVGGTNIVCGLVTPSGEVVHRIKRATEVSKGPDAILEKSHP